MSNELYEFTTPIVITTIKTYRKFLIKKINIPFNNDADVEVWLMDNDNVFKIENITIPRDLYLEWKYDENYIIDFCKNYLESLYHGGGS